MASNVNNPRTSTGSSTSPPAAAADAGTGSLSLFSSSDFFPHADASGRTWLSLGSYEEVFNSDFDYWSVHKDLHKCNMKLERILKIHNDNLKDRFEKEVELLKKSKGTGFIPNIQELYHGTRESLDKICYEGLDQRLSTSGHFGRGIYFSDSPEICRIESEAVPRQNQKPFILMCRVLLGESKVYQLGQSDPSLTREPVKTSVDGKNLFYDSVQGQSGKFKQFVLYEKRRAMIRYVIFYTAAGPLPVLPPVPSSSSAKPKRPRSKERQSKRPRSREKRSRSTGRHSSSSGERSSSTKGRSRSTERRSRSTERRSSSNCSQSSGGSPGRDRSRSSDRSGSPASSGGSRCSNDGMDDLRAVGGASTSSNKSSENQTTASQSQNDPVESTPKVATTRNRTRRLLSEANTPISSASGGATAAAAAPASVPVSASSSASKGADHASEVYKAKVQESAMKHMLSLKGRVTDRQMNELFDSYSNTYGGTDLPTSQDMSSDDVNAVMDSLITDFQNVVGNVDRSLAYGYILQHDMDVERAIGAYLDENY